MRRVAASRNASRQLERRGCPGVRRMGDAAAQHVHQPILDTRILVAVVAGEPDRQPEGVLQQHVRARAVEVRLRAARGRSPERPGGAKDALPACHQPAAHRRLRRAKVGQDRERLRLARLDPCEPGHVEGDVMPHPRLRGRPGERLVQHRLEFVERVLEAGGGEVFLALEIIGDAGGVEPDAARDIGEGHPLRALFVDRLCRGGQDRVAFLAEAHGPQRADRTRVGTFLAQRFLGRHRASLPASIRTPSPFFTRRGIALPHTLPKIGYGLSGRRHERWTRRRGD